MESNQFSERFAMLTTDFLEADFLPAWLSLLNFQIACHQTAMPNRTCHEYALPERRCRYPVRNTPRKCGALFWASRENRVTEQGYHL